MRWPSYMILQPIPSEISLNMRKIWFSFLSVYGNMNTGKKTTYIVEWDQAVMTILTVKGHKESLVGPLIPRFLLRWGDLTHRSLWHRWVKNRKKLCELAKTRAQSWCAELYIYKNDEQEILYCTCSDKRTFILLYRNKLLLSYNPI